jgi:hypothetical protein
MNAVFPRLQQCEEDKITKDSQIKSLNEELVNQEELVARLQKEKKQAQMSCIISSQYLPFKIFLSNSDPSHYIVC